MANIARLITSFTRSEIKQLFNTAQSIVKQQGLEIRRAPTNQEIAKLLLITPRRIGNAPKRNSIRRRLKAIFYEEKLFDRRYDLIVLVSKQGINLSFDQLKTIVLKAYDQ